MLVLENLIEVVDYDHEPITNLLSQSRALGLSAAVTASTRDNEKAPGTVLTFALGKEIQDIYREDQSEQSITPIIRTVPQLQLIE